MKKRFVYERKILGYGRTFLPMNGTNLGYEGTFLPMNGTLDPALNLHSSAKIRHFLQNAFKRHENKVLIVLLWFSFHLSKFPID